MKRLKIITGAFFIIAMFALVTPANASEGTAELVSTNKNNTRCFATSILTEKFEYKISITCRNLIYPPAEDAFAYLLWATPVAGGNPIKLGALGFGKAELKTKKAFSSLFITIESNSKAKKPSQNLVARGALKEIELLTTGKPSQDVPIEEGPAEDFGEIIEQPAPFVTPTQESGGLFSGIRRGALIAVVGIFLILLILAFITRARG